MKPQFKGKVFLLENYNMEISKLLVTGVDVWLLEDIQTVEDKELIDKILVKHINKVGNRTGKMQFHAQRYAYDLDYVFTNIIAPHETYNKVYSKAFRIKELLATI